MPILTSSGVKTWEHEHPDEFILCKIYRNVRVQTVETNKRPLKVGKVGLGLQITRIGQ